MASKLTVKFLLLNRIKMKLLYNLPKVFIVIAFLGTLLASCKDELPEAIDSSSKLTELKSIKIINAGAGGNIVLEGTIDEDKKTIRFPRIDPETDFSNLKFEVQTSDGATLDKESYAVTFEEGVSEKSIIIKVTNLPRYREYLATFRLRVPVYGADFEKGQIYDYTNNPLGNPHYDIFGGALTRGAGFDGEHVLVVTRNAVGSHLLKVTDLKNNELKRIPLNLTGVSLGTFVVNMGAQVKGHTYIANLSGATAASPMRIYHWTDPSAEPNKIVDLNVGIIAGAGVRHGDHFSASLDDNGNGYFFFGDNAGTKILRLKVENWTTVSDPVAFAIPTTGAGSWTTYNRIGNTSEYIFTGHDAPVSLVNESGTVTYSMSRTAIPIRSSDARVIHFNGERYLIATTAARTGSESTNFVLYDITRGGSVAEGLTILNGLPERKPLVDYSLMGPVNTSPSSHTGWAVKKNASGEDETLVLFSAASDAGFVFFEFPKKVLEDE
jgi:hypothetical protein